MPDFIYLGARSPGDWYVGARETGPIFLGYSPLLPDDGGETPGGDTITMRWEFNDAVGPFANVGAGQSTGMEIVADGDAPTFEDGLLVLPKGTYLRTLDQMDWAFADTGDTNTNFTPKRLRFSFYGIVDPGSYDSVLIEYYKWANGSINLRTFWEGDMLRMDAYREGVGESQCKSDSDPRRALGTLQLYEAEWVDDPTGPGGTVNFYVDGTPFGEARNATNKPRLPGGDRLYVSASLGNTSNGANMKVGWIEVTYEI